MPQPKTPLLTVDCVVVDVKSRVLLIRRKNQPFQGDFALPGGFVDIGETVEAACRRELLEETSVNVEEIRLVGVYSDPKRDPRGHTCSVVYLARVASTEAKAGDDAAALFWADDWRSLTLAFDHRQILTDAFALLDTLSPQDGSHDHG